MNQAELTLDDVKELLYATDVSIMMLNKQITKLSEQVEVMRTQLSQRSQDEGVQLSD
jgi:chaperonin cofactor prefoldin